MAMVAGTAPAPAATSTAAAADRARAGVKHGRAVNGAGGGVEVFGVDHLVAAPGHPEPAGGHAGIGRLGHQVGALQVDDAHAQALRLLMPFIDGALRPSRSTTTIDIVEPATEDVIGHIADASDAEVDEAIEIAARARKAWNAIDARSRAVTLHDIAARIRSDKTRYAEYLTREEGKPFELELATGKRVTVTPFEVCRGYARLAPPTTPKMQDYHWLMSLHPLELPQLRHL